MDPEVLRLLQQLAQGSNAASAAAERLAVSLTNTDTALTGTASTASKTSSSLNSLTAKVTPLGAAINAVAQAVAGYIGVQARLTQSVIQFQSSIHDTENVFSNMAQGIDREFKYVKDAVDSTVGPFAQLAKQIPGLGSIIGATESAAKAALDVVKEANRQNMKVLTDSFNAMGNLTGSFGVLSLEVEQFSEMATKAGLTSDQFSRMLLTNSKNLSATFGGSSRASKILQQEFSALTTKGNQTRATFVAMGMSNDDMAEAMAEYANNQRILGLRQQYETGELSRRTLDYQRNLAAISALTGESVKEQQADRKRRLDQANFAAKIEQLTAEGKADEAMALQEAVAAAAKFGPAFEKVAIEQAVYGRAMSAEANKTILTNRALGQATQAAIDGTNGFTGSQAEAQAQALQVFQDREAEIKAGRDATRGLSMLAGLTDSSFINSVGETFVVTRDTIAKTGTMADEFNTALEKTILTEKGRTAQIAEESARQQRMRVETENNSMDQIDSTLRIATAFSDIAEELQKSRQDLVNGVTEFTNALIRETGKLVTPENIQDLANEYDTARANAEQTPERRALVDRSKELDKTIQHGSPEEARKAYEEQKEIKRLLKELKRQQRDAAGPNVPGGYGPGAEPKDPSTDGEAYSAGGVATGPESGYKALLHGIEAVVPLPDGKNIPVELMTDSFEEKLSAMISSLAKTDSSTDDRIPQLLSRMVALQEEMTNLQKSSNKTSNRMVRVMS